MKKLLYPFIFLIFLFVLVSCKKDEQVEKNLVNSFEILHDEIIMFDEEEVEISYKLGPKDADNEYIFWTTDNHRIAKVDQEGLLVATGPGITYLHGETYDGELKDKVKVTVYEIDRPVESITINGLEEDEIDVGFEEIPIDILVELVPFNADNQRFTLTSSNNDIVLVTDDNRIRYIATGKATITATSEDGDFKANLVINVIPPKLTNLKLDRRTVYGAVGALPAYIQPVFNSHEVANKTVTWQVANQSIATVNANTGAITFLQNGETTITATTQDGNYSATAIIKVVEPTLITTPEELQALDTTPNALDSGKYYMLANDIDMLDATTNPSGTLYNSGSGFKPIGFYDDDAPSTARKFNGTLDGNGYTISNMHINRASEYNLGLFVYIGSQGQVRNLNIVGGEIVGRIMSPIFGANDGIVENSYLEMKLTYDRNWNGAVAATVTDGARMYNIVSNTEMNNNKYGFAVAGRNYGYIENVYVNKDLLPPLVLNNPYVDKKQNNALALNVNVITYEEMLNTSLYSALPSEVWDIREGFIPKIKQNS